MKNKIEKIKELYAKYKEAKKDPRKRAGMKLLGYFIFFFIFMLIASIGNSIKQAEISEKLLTTTTTNIVDRYSEKQKKLLEDKYNIEYIIKVDNKEYKINGTIKNNVVTGYLEGLDNIKKIILKNNSIYEIKEDIENNIEVAFNINYLNLEYILNSIKDSNVIKNETEDIKIYNYNVELDGVNFNVSIKTDEENIVGLELKNDINNYILNFDK